MYWWFLDRFASYGGVYFDEDMNPLINTKSGLMALKNMVECLAYMPPGSLGWSYMEVRTALTKGDGAMGWRNLLSSYDRWWMGSDYS